MRLSRLNPGFVAAGSTLQLSKAIHDGKVIKLDTASGSVVTLPAALGTGGRYKFVSTVTPTTNNHIVKVQNSTDTMVGALSTCPTTIGGAVAVTTQEAAGGTDDTITLNGTTGGGIIGSKFELEDIAPGLWLVSGQLVSSGAGATTPFSATV